MGLPRALALGYLVKNLPDQGNIVVSCRHHCRASRAASGHLYGLVEWKMLSASLASSFHLEFGRLVPLLDASPPMPRVGFALRCARPRRAQRSTLSVRRATRRAAEAERAARFYGNLGELAPEMMAVRGRTGGRWRAPGPVERRPALARES